MEVLVEGYDVDESTTMTESYWNASDPCGTDKGGGSGGASYCNCDCNCDNN